MEELRRDVVFPLGFMLLTLNSGLDIYLSLDDMELAASLAVSYAALVLVFVSQLSGGGGGSGGRGRWLRAGIWCLTSLLEALLAYKLVTIVPPSMSLLLVAVGGATVALGVVGGSCAFLLQRQSWTKQPCLEVVLPLVQELP